MATAGLRLPLFAMPGVRSGEKSPSPTSSPASLSPAVGATAVAAGSGAPQTAAAAASDNPVPSLCARLPLLMAVVASVDVAVTAAEVRLGAVATGADLAGGATASATATITADSNSGGASCGGGEEIGGYGGRWWPAAAAADDRATGVVGLHVAGAVGADASRSRGGGGAAAAARRSAPASSTGHLRGSDGWGGQRWTHRIPGERTGVTSLDHRDACRGTQQDDHGRQSNSICRGKTSQAITAGNAVSLAAQSYLGRSFSNNNDRMVDLPRRCACPRPKS